PPERLPSGISFGARHMIATGLALRSISYSDSELDELFEAFQVYYEQNIAVESRPFEGLTDLLQDCLSEGAKLAICTNKLESLSRQLVDQLGLTRLFSALAGRDTFPVCKPHPDHLLGAIRLAGRNPAHAVMVGDSEVDISTAKATRVPVIGVTFGYTRIPVTELGADAIIDSYAEFRAALDRVLPRPS